jgi:hypothetical protein
LPRFVPRLGEDREQNGGKDRDDSDDYEKLDKRKRRAFSQDGVHIFPPSGQGGADIPAIKISESNRTAAQRRRKRSPKAAAFPSSCVPIKMPESDQGQKA